MHLLLGGISGVPQWIVSNSADHDNPPSGISVIVVASFLLYFSIMSDTNNGFQIMAYWNGDIEKVDVTFRYKYGGTWYTAT